MEQRRGAVCARHCGTGTLTVYDELGEVSFTALDVNENGLIDLGGPDRVQSSETLYTQDGGGLWRRKSSQSVYADPSGLPTVTGQSLQRLTGLGAGGLTGGRSNLIQGCVVLSGNPTDSELATENACAAEGHLRTPAAQGRP